MATDKWNRVTQSSVVGMFLLAALYTVWVARPVLLPILLAGLLAATLAPPVGALKRLGIPRWLGAVVVLVCSVSTIVFGASRIIGPATEWVASLPELVDDAREELEGVFRSTPSRRPRIRCARRPRSGTAMLSRRSLPWRSLRSARSPSIERAHLWARP
jgi:predicted PurR-regulated permease PerM